MVRNRPPSSSSPPLQPFINEAAQEPFPNLKNRSVFFEQGFVFTSDGLGSEIKDVVIQHKWKKFAKHPRDVNSTLVKEFMLTSSTQSNIRCLFEVNTFVLPLLQLIAISSCRMLLTVTQHSKRKRAMKLTMTL
ncbi:hypothetical protein V6N13_098770 [Hibiscus sabdariffa]